MPDKFAPPVANHLTGRGSNSLPRPVDLPLLASILPTAPTTVSRMGWSCT